MIEPILLFLIGMLALFTFGLWIAKPCQGASATERHTHTALSIACYAVLVGVIICEMAGV